jgi:hypothetical protein
MGVVYDDIESHPAERDNELRAPMRGPAAANT